MKAKLMKNGTTTYVLVKDGEVVGNMKNLSLKNCQAIERGYDLEDLATDSADNYDASGNWHVAYELYKAGFQKALELMSDKKYSEDDVILIAEYIRVASQSTPNVRTKDLFDEYQSLQQTEWDVEIEMEYIGECDGNNNDGCFQDSPAHNCGCFERKPKLDEDGCLILKRI